jgi:hypothetical protein
MPAVLITSPPFDGGVLAGNVTVTVEVEGPLPGSHLIYYMDVVPPVAGGRPAYTAAGTYAVSSLPFYSWTGVPPGTHTFAVQMVNPEDAPLEPPVLDAVDVTAVSPSQIAVPRSPA